MRVLSASKVLVRDMDTKALKRRLEKHLDEALSQLQREAEVPKPETAGSDFFDIAQGVELQELTRLTASRIAERAKRLRVALMRVEDGDYGVCSECGGAIAPKRLLAVPDATTCVACQERLERTRA